MSEDQSHKNYSEEDEYLADRLNAALQLKPDDNTSSFSSKFIINRIENEDWNQRLSNVQMLDEERIAMVKELDMVDHAFACIATNLPHQLFLSSNSTQQYFEELFTFNQSRPPSFLYFRSFRRCRIAYETASELKVACTKHCVFSIPIVDDAGVQSVCQCRCYAAASNKYPPGLVKNANSRFLEPPIPLKQFLISPPSSPPVGWQQQIEPIPFKEKLCDTALSAAVNAKQEQLAATNHAIDSDALVAALLKLQNEQQNMREQNIFDSRSDEIPSITLHRCNDQY